MGLESNHVLVTVKARMQEQELTWNRNKPQEIKNNKQVVLSYDWSQGVGFWSSVAEYTEFLVAVYSCHL